jgi:hypothetical protein
MRSRSRILDGQRVAPRLERMTPARRPRWYTAPGVGWALALICIGTAMIVAALVRAW